MDREIIKLLESLPGGNNLIRSVDEFNDACDHISAMLDEATVLLHHGGYSSSLFLSITAIEETAKAHVGIFSAGGPDPESRKKNIFFQHITKHRLAAQPTVGMGSRLKEALGEKRVNELLTEASSGDFLDSREKALYFQRVDGIISTPRQVINLARAKEVLLLAIEIFDDALVGFSNHSHILSGTTDKLFEQVSQIEVEN